MKRFTLAVCIFLLTAPTVVADEFYSPETSRIPEVNYSPETSRIPEVNYSPETATVPLPDPQYGPVWTNYDGLSVWDHLAQDHHRGKIIGNFRSLSRSQAVDLHSDLHNTGRVLDAKDYGATETIRCQVEVIPTQGYTYSPETPALAGVDPNCPDGNCPIRVLSPVTIPVRTANLATRTVVQQSRTVLQRARTWRPIQNFFSRIRRSRDRRAGRSRQVSRSGSTTYGDLQSRGSS